jgi:[pyruvate, water dikinase]-phosphate phosphotransferase / [pyruvate, water dikinase] kinase
MKTRVRRSVRTRAAATRAGGRPEAVGGAPLRSRVPPTILVVSDGRGDTCAQVVRAALVQFEDRPHRLLQISDVRSTRRVSQVIRRAVSLRAVVFYTLVGDETRAAMLRLAREHLVPSVDVLGPAFSALQDLFKQVPGTTPGLLYASNRELFARQAAIDFALRHDDGQRPDDLDGADIVLVGVSRSSKTSTCFFLAYEGIKAANVPLVPGIPPPPQLLKLPPKSVIGLRLNVARLLTVREMRATHLGLSEGDDYLEESAVAREVIDADRLMERHGWQSIDISYLAVEEIARAVVRLRWPEQQGRQHGSSGRSEQSK